MTSVRVEHGDMRDVLNRLITEGVTVQSIVTDPPYGLEFMGKDWDAPWQISSQSALFGDRNTKMPGFSTTRNPTCRACGGRLRGAKKCACDAPEWDEAPNATRLRQMSGFQDWMQECAELMFQILTPGGHIMVFGGTRTYHRMVCAVEDVGFEIRDTIAWLYGSGFPKSHNVAKSIDRKAGKKGAVVGKVRAGIGRNARNGGEIVGGAHDEAKKHIEVTAPATAEAAAWQGWGTALKPATELICVARKPLIGSVADNVLKHGTGALNIDGCRVGLADSEDVEKLNARSGGHRGFRAEYVGSAEERGSNPPADLSKGRWPANVAHDGSDEVVGAFPAESSVTGARSPRSRDASVKGTNWLSDNHRSTEHIDSGSPARFFYSSKADADDRLGSKHPTVKPVDLMRWLVRLVTPPGGTVLDPFAGSGTTGMACLAEGFDAILVEREAEYVADIRRRIAHVHGDDTPLFEKGAA